MRWPRRSIGRRFQVVVIVGVHLVELLTSENEIPNRCAGSYPLISPRHRGKGGVCCVDVASLALLVSASAPRSIGPLQPGWRGKKEEGAVGAVDGRNRRNRKE